MEKVPFWQSNTIRALAAVIVGQLIVVAGAYAAGSEISVPYLVGTFVVPVLVAVLRMLNTGTAEESTKVAVPGKG
jgi:hypothetical protein